MKLKCQNCDHTADESEFPEAEDTGPPVGPSPGPWKTDTSHAHEWEGITIWAGDVVIAHVVSDQHGQEQANARLISGAPALLAALRRIITIDACITVEGGKQAREAIAKAEEIVSPERPQKTSEFVECLAMMNHHVGSYLDGGESTQEDIERWMDVASDLIGAVQSKKGGES